MKSSPSPPQLPSPSSLYPSPFPFAPSWLVVCLFLYLCLCVCVCVVVFDFISCSTLLGVCSITVVDIVDIVVIIIDEHVHTSISQYSELQSYSIAFANVCLCTYCLAMCISYSVYCVMFSSYFSGVLVV